MGGSRLAHRGSGAPSPGKQPQHHRWNQYGDGGHRVPGGDVGGDKCGGIKTNIDRISIYLY